MGEKGRCINLVEDEKTLREERIKKETSRLNGIFRGLSKNTKKVAESLIKNAAFMTIILEDLQEEINKNGPVSEYQNGENQWGTKKSPEVEIYNTMIKNHSTVMKQLADLLPKETPKQEDDGFDDFVGAK